MKYWIASSRKVGKNCADWAAAREPEGWTLGSPTDFDVYISVLSTKIVEVDPTKRYYNIHPGKLPEYAGAGGCTWAIINKEKEFFITCHEIDSGIDTGDIINTFKVLITEDDTAESLFNKVEQKIYGSFIYNFENLLLNNYEATPQVGNRTYYPRNKIEKTLDLTRMVRAFTFKGKDNLFYYDKEGVKHELKWK